MRHLLAAALVAVSLGPAWAAPPTSESIETLLTLTKSESTMDAYYTNMERAMRQGVSQSMADQSLTPQQQRAIDLVPSKVIALMRSELNWNTLRPDFIRLYQETFEQDEVDGLIAFYRSPAGQAYINKIPAVMEKSMQLTQSHMARLMPKMKQAMDEALREARAAQ